MSKISILLTKFLLFRCLYIVLQLAKGGEIFEYLKFSGEFLPEEARYFFHQLVEGIEFCHKKGYAHRDLKPENLLLDENFNLLIADFGFCGALDGKEHDGLMHTNLGTLPYKAPEILESSGTGYDGVKVDIFSMGINLFILYSGVPPFNKACRTDPLYRFLMDKDYVKFWKVHSRNRKPGYFSEGFVELVQDMMQHDPAKRPSIQDIKASEWYNGDVSTQAQILASFNKRKELVDRILRRKPIEPIKGVSPVKTKKRKRKRDFFIAIGKKIRAAFRDGDRDPIEQDKEMGEKFKEIMAKIEKVNDSHVRHVVSHEQAKLIPNSMEIHICPIDLFRYIIYLCFSKTQKVLINFDKLTIYAKIPTKFAYVGIKFKIMELQNYSILQYVRKEGSSLKYFNELNEFMTQIHAEEARILESESEEDFDDCSDGDDDLMDQEEEIKEQETE